MRPIFASLQITRNRAFQIQTTRNMKSVDSFLHFIAHTRNSLADHSQPSIYTAGRRGFFKSLHKLDLQGSLREPVCETLVKYRNTMKFPFALAPTIARAIRNSDKTLLKMLIFIERWRVCRMANESFEAKNS